MKNTYNNDSDNDSDTDSDSDKSFSSDSAASNYHCYNVTDLLIGFFEVNFSILESYNFGNKVRFD